MPTEKMLLDSTGLAINGTLENAANALNMCGAMLRVLASDKIISETINWQHVNNIVAQGLGPSAFPIGTQFIVKWTDNSVNPAVEYDCPWDVTYHGPVVLEDGETVPGMYLQMHWCTKDAITFCHNHGFYKVPAGGLPAGDYCVKLTQAAAGQPANSYFCFTFSSAAPEGAILSGLHYIYSGSTTVASLRVYVWTHGNDASPAQTLTVTASSSQSGTLLATLDTSSTNVMLNGNAVAYGYNRYRDCSARQYLNSAAGKGSWWTSKNDGDVRPDELANVVGFMAGFSDDFLNAIGKTKIQVATNTVTDGGVTDVVYDKFFLPSLEQEYCSPQAASVEGNYWPYWKAVTGLSSPSNATNVNRIRYRIDNHTSASYVWLRSANRGLAYTTWYVSSGGGVGHSGAFSASRLAPACVICGKTTIS